MERVSVRPSSDSPPRAATVRDIPVSLSTVGEAPNPRREQIAARAYQLWEVNGKMTGTDSRTGSRRSGSCDREAPAEPLKRRRNWPCGNWKLRHEERAMASPYHARSERAANRTFTTSDRGRRAFAVPARRFVPLVAELESRSLLSGVTVVSNADSGPGSLRAAIDSAVPGEVITFARNLRGQTIALASPLLVDTSLTIHGFAQGPTISGNSSTEIFTISSGRVGESDDAHDGQWQLRARRGDR